MDKKQRILKKYKYLIIIKKTIIGTGIISTLSLLFTLYIKDISRALMFVGAGITFCTLILFCLLWVSIPNVKKHILELIEKS